MANKLIKLTKLMFLYNNYRANYPIIQVDSMHLTDTHIQIYIYIYTYTQTQLTNQNIIKYIIYLYILLIEQH